MSDKKEPLQPLSDERLNELDHSEIKLEYQKLAKVIREASYTKRKLAKAQELAQMAKWEYDLIDHSVNWSDGLFVLLGYKVNEVEPCPERFSKHIHPEDRDSIWEGFARTQDEQEGFYTEYRIIRKDAKEITVQAYGERIYENGRPKYIGYLYDISDSKEVLRRYDNLFNGSPIGIIMADARSGRVVEVNTATSEILGYSEKELVSKPINNILPDHEREMVRLHLEVLQHSSKVSFETEWKHRSGNLIPVEITLSKATNHGGEPAVMASMIDLTPKRQVEWLNNQLVHTTSAIGGSPYFNELSELLGASLEMEYTMIGLFNEEKNSVQTLSYYKNGKPLENITYDLENTPCSKVVGNHMCVFEKGVQQEFPLDIDLKTLNIESYIGIPLFFDCGKPLGLVVAMDEKPLENVTLKQSLIESIVKRTESEMIRARREQELAESEKRLNLLFQGAPDAYYIRNQDGKILDCNEAAEKMFQLPKEDMVHRNMLDLGFFTEKEKEKALIAFKEIANGEAPKPKEFIVDRPDGSRIVVETLTQSIELQGEEVVLGIARDVTMRKKAEREISDYEKHFSLTNDLFCIASTNGHFIKINPQFKTVLGYTEDVLINNPFIEFVHEDDVASTVAEIQKLAEGIPTVEFKNRYRCINGKYKWLLWSATPDVKTGLLYAAAKDITDLKEAEEALQQTLADLENQVETRTEQLQTNHAKLKEINANFVASLDYAKLIQEASLPSSIEMGKAFQSHFVVFKPKDIVSGDFYWLYKNNSKVTMVLADCTGHGVPGALMTMAGHQALSNIVVKREIDRPDIILEEMNEAVTQLLKRKTAQVSMNDGMDISVVTIDYDKGVFHYASAHGHGLFIGTESVEKLKASRTSVGGIGGDKTKRFKLYRYAYKTGDRLYLYSDGIYDQFGGPDGKKLLRKNFEALLVNNSEKGLDEQKLIIESTYHDWKGSINQVDDVSIIGIEL